MSYFKLSASAALLFALAGCSSPWITNTSRSAVEQQLISTVVERGMAKTDFSCCSGKKVLIDYTFLDPQTDKAYVQGCLELRLAQSGVTITQQAGEEDLIVQVTSGVLATDQKKILIGCPSLPLPIPDTTMTFVIPEIPLFLKMTRYAFSRFSFNILTPDRKPVAAITGINSKAHYTNWVILMIPFVSYDMPLAIEGDAPEDDYKWDI